ncbi:MAG: LysE family transporter [Gammaproteobacteria bacterium]|nr:LysE family transporter [Gammaproteobacteria bacterium]
MEFWQGLLVITGVHLLAAMSPGPDFVLVSQHTLKYGKRSGLWCGLGIALGLSVHIIYSVLGLATLIAHSAPLLWVVKIVGGAYLLYLGIQGLRSKATPIDNNNSTIQRESISLSKSLSLGFACNVLNPKAPIYFIAVFTVVLSPDLPWWQLSVYGIAMIILQWLWFSAVVMILSLPALNRKFQQAGHWLDRIFGVAMIGLGIKVIRS